MAKQKYKAGVSAERSLRVPITNIHDGNDYSAQLLIGSEKTPVNLLLDTGSSTLAVSSRAYNAIKDKLAKPTSYIQLVTYGSGGWAGPLVNTMLTIGDKNDSLSLHESHIAISAVEEKGNFTGVHGILGLAYNGLNAAYDMEKVLAEKKIRHTHPWPFDDKDFKSFNKKFGRWFGTGKTGQKNILPYFTELERKGVTANKFAFYTLRSLAHHGTADKSKSAADPLNHGFFILGGGEEQRDLYKGGEEAFLTVDVCHDFYYNAALKGVQVEGFERINARPLQKKYVAASISNAIIDTGTNILAPAPDVHSYIMSAFGQINAKLPLLAERSAKGDKGIEMKLLNLAEWPDIHFFFGGVHNAEVKLTCTPGTYWQVNTPDYNRTVCQIQPTGDNQNQSIFGLPLLNNYYTVFDRSVHRHGVVRFAPINKPEGKTHIK